MRASYAPAGSGPFASATIPLWDMGRALGEGVVAEGAHAWLRRLVSTTLRAYYARPRAERVGAAEDLPEEAASHAIVRRACLRTAAMGGATGLLTTLTSVATTETDGLAGLIAVPAACVAIAVEAVARLGVHLTMICAIADLFEIAFDAEEPADLWALLALSFGPGKTPANPPRAGEHVIHLAGVKAEEVAAQIGKWIAGESVAKNAIPFVSVASSSVTSFLVTQRLGDNARRYLRYRRAFDDLFTTTPGLLSHLDLIVEGVWFIFTADGNLSPEESALLASLVRRSDPGLHARISTDLADDIAWVGRLSAIPEPLRDPFLELLEVAAAVDKTATLRERRLLEHAARALGRREDFGGLERMIRDFREVGVLSRTETS
jgi:hypothetical protein